MNEKIEFIRYYVQHVIMDLYPSIKHYLENKIYDFEPVYDDAVIFDLENKFKDLINEAEAKKFLEIFEMNVNNFSREKIIQHLYYLYDSDEEYETDDVICEYIYRLMQKRLAQGLPFY